MSELFRMCKSRLAVHSYEQQTTGDSVDGKLPAADKNTVNSSVVAGKGGLFFVGEGGGRNVVLYSN